MRTTLLLVAVLVLTLAVAPAFAQDPGDIGIFFDPSGVQTSGSINVSVPFNLYVVAFDAPGGIFGYELSINTTMIPGTYFLLAAVVEPAASATNFGTLENWIVGAGICYPSSGPTLLGTLTYLLLTPVVDAVFSIGPSSPSSFTPAAPGYVTCLDPNDLRTFGLAENGGDSYPDGSAVGNPTNLPPVAEEQESWGAVKALFR